MTLLADLERIARQLGEEKVLEDRKADLDNQIKHLEAEVAALHERHSELFQKVRRETDAIEATVARHRIAEFKLAVAQDELKKLLQTAQAA